MKKTIAFSQTALFQKIILDYVAGEDALKNFCGPFPSEENLLKQIEGKTQNAKRDELVAYFQQEYSNPTQKQQNNISHLEQENTFTVCVAHQPNIFLGPLYTIYKIVECVKTAEKYSTQKHKLVPVFFMGSEDADFEELSTISIKEKKVQWQTKQRGAFGRLSLEDLQQHFDEIKKEIKHLPYFKEIEKLFEEHYLKQPNIKKATFELINELFKDNGLLIVDPDSVRLKKMFVDFMLQDIIDQSSKPEIEKSINALKPNYKIQATPRGVNFFYLYNQHRERIEYKNETFFIPKLKLVFSGEQMRQEIKTYPERFSPNVFLRALMQESILPNIAFIGGGGEIAYWLEMKNMFVKYGVDFPLLIVRNSMIIVEEKIIQKKINKNTFHLEEIFQTEEKWLKQKAGELMNRERKIKIKQHLRAIEKKYEEIQTEVENKMPHLQDHLKALRKKHTTDFLNVEKKILRAYKKELETEKAQRQQIVRAIFPNGTFQERNQNFIYFYAKYGQGFFEQIEQAITPLDSKIHFLFMHTNEKTQ